MSLEEQLLRRAVLQTLESLQQAGLTHMPGAADASELADLAQRAMSGEPDLTPGQDAGSAGHAQDAHEGEQVQHSEPKAKELPMAPKSQTREQRQMTLDQLAKEVAKCGECNELASSRTQTVFGIGNPQARLVFLGEAPGRDEDEQGVPFVGRAGKLLTDIIEKGMKISRDDVYICNILRCRPPGNRNPAPLEATRCRKWLDGTLDVIKPEFICCLGAVAAQNLLDTEQTIGRMRGQFFEYNGIRVMCTYHPAYLLRNPAAKKEVWKDIQMLMREMGLEV